MMLRKEHPPLFANADVLPTLVILAVFSESPSSWSQVILDYGSPACRGNLINMNSRG